MFKITNMERVPATTVTPFFSGGKKFGFLGSVVVNWFLEVAMRRGKRDPGRMKNLQFLLCKLDRVTTKR